MSQGTEAPHEPSAVGRRLRWRAGIVLSVVALLVPLVVAVVATTSATSASAAAPDPIPDGLWDAPSPFAGEIEPSKELGDYLIVEGAAGDTVIGDQTFAWTRRDGDNPGPALYYENELTSIASDGQPGQNTQALLFSVTAPGGGRLTEPGFYPYIVQGLPDADRAGVEIRTSTASSGWTGCEGPISGWVAIDHIRLMDPEGFNSPATSATQGAQPGELDMRIEQSCDGAPPIHLKYHTDLVDESVYGPDPVPPGLWDITPPGVGDQDYVFVDGADGDPQTSGGDSLLIGDGFGVRDENDFLAMFLRIGDDGWIGSFMNYRGRGVVEPGYYPVHTDVRVAPLEPPFLAWEKLGVPGCTTTDGWFAVDDIVRLDGQIVKLDLRLEQSCNGNPPLHVKIHLDRVTPPTTTTTAPPTTTTTAPTTSTTVPPSTTSTTRPPSTTSTTVPPSTTSTTRPPSTTSTTVPPATTTTTAPPTTTTTAPSTTSTTSTTRPPTTTTTAPPPPPPVLTRPPGPPFGSLDVASPSAGSIQVAGWAVDPDTAAPIPVHVYVDGQGTALIADVARGDVAAVFAGYGSAHGFSASVPATGGSHQVCAFGINVGVGANSVIGCQQVTVASGAPFGALDVAAGEPGAVAAAGWAIDPDTAAPVPVHVYVDGVGTATTANGVRPDVGAAFPGYGSPHGFGVRVATGPGTHTVCAYAINVGPGANSLIGCRQVTVPGGPPFGALDVAAPVAGGVRVAGWAIDPDVAAPIDVHVYVDGTGKATAANVNRPDVDAAFPPYGPAHGYDITVPAGPGTHQVCAYGINVATGSNSLLACRTVTLP